MICLHMDFFYLGYTYLLESMGLYLLTNLRAFQLYFISSLFLGLNDMYARFSAIVP